MRLEYITSFVGVVNYKSFSLAAKYLYLSQPTISTHIKQLETELGVQLLVRSTKDVILSEEGKIFYPYALKLLATEHEALKELGKNEDEAGRLVTVAVSSVPGYYMFPHFLAHFRMENTDVGFKVMEGDSGDVLRKLLDFTADLGLGSLDSGNDKIHTEVLFKDEIVLIAPNTAKYRNMNGRFPLEQLRKECFITREIGSGTKKISENMEQELGLDVSALHVAAQFESSEMVRRAVETGAGVAFISRTAARESLERQRVLEFSFENVNSQRNIYLMYHKERTLGRGAESVAASLREFCRQRY